MMRVLTLLALLPSLAWGQVYARLDPLGSGRDNALRIQNLCAPGRTVLIDAPGDCPVDPVLISRQPGLSLSMSPSCDGRLVAETVGVRLTDCPDVRVSLRIVSKSPVPASYAFGADALVSLIRCDRGLIRECDLEGAPVAAIAAKDCEGVRIEANAATGLHRRGIVVRGGSNALVVRNSVREMRDPAGYGEHMIDLHGHTGGRVENNSVYDVLCMAYQDTLGKGNVWSGNRALDVGNGFFKIDGGSDVSFTSGTADNVGGCVLELGGQNGKASGRIEFSGNRVRGVSAKLYGKGLTKQSERFRLIRSLGLAPSSTFVLRDNAFERITPDAYLFEGFDPSVNQDLSGNDFGGARLIEPAKASGLRLPETSISALLR